MQNDNQHDPGSPEWQLFENVISNERLAQTYAKDAERALENANIARNRAAKFREALEKLLA